MAKPLVEVAIGADGSVFVREVDKATASSKQFGSAVKDAGDKAKQSAKDSDAFAAGLGKAAKYATAAAAAAAAGAALFVKSAIDQADAVGILAGKLGVTTESLSKLEYAAKLADVSQGALEQGLKKLSVTLTQAQDPGSKLAELFGVLGLNAKELIKLPADEALGRIGDALGRVANANERAAVAQQIFGRSGQALLPILAEGTAGIKRSGDELERFGGVISGDLAQRAQQFNDNLDRLKSAASGLGLSVADQLVGPMNEFAEQLIGLSQKKEVAEGIATFITGIGTALVTTANIISTTANVWKYLGEEIAAAVGGPAVGDFERINAAINTAKNGIAYLEGKQKALSGGLQVRSFSEEDQARLDKYRAELARLEQMLRVSEQLEQDRAKAVKAASDATAVATGQTNAATAANGRQTASTLSVTSALGAQTNKTKDVIAQLQFEVAQLTKTDREQRISNALRSAGADAASEQGKQIARLTGILFDHEESMRRNKAALDEMDQGMADLEKGMSKTEEKSNPWADALQGAVERVDSAFVDMWKNIGSGFDSFADSLKDAFKQLLAELANLAITRPIMMRIGAALGLGGSSSAMASGGGVGGIGGIGSLFSGAKSFMSGFQSGGLSGGIDALFGGSGSGITQGLVSFNEGLASFSRALGFDGLAKGFGGNALTAEMSTVGQNLVNIGGNLLQGFAGNWAGNKVGQALFGERQTTGIGGAVGGVIGSALPIPVVGTLIGSFLGSLAENAIGKIFGLGDQAKWGKLGVTTGSGIPTDGSALQTITGASGLTLTAVAKRTDADAAKQLLEGFNAIDSALTEAARAAGVTVDFTNKVLGNTSLNVDGQGPKNSFGVGARLDKFSADAIKGSADDFARAWISEINDQLTGRVKAILGDTSKRTAEQIVQVFGFASKLDKLLKLDVLKEVADAAATAQKTLLDVYSEATDAVANLAQEYDGSLESMTGLTDALTSQKQVAAQLAAAYQEVSQLVDATFGNAINTIEESMLSEADLYQRRREQIASLTAELSTTIDPAKIANLVQQIDNLTSSAFGMLDESQRSQMSQEFIGFLKQAQTLADQQIQAGKDSLASRETAIANAVDLEVMNTAALTQQAAANTFADAVNRFAGVVGGKAFGLDPEQIAAYLRAQGVEVPG